VLRVPLLIHGPRAAARLVERPVSLIDVAPTVADMARVPPLPGWMGRSLLGAAEERPIYAFQCRGASTETTLAVVSGMRKLIGYEDKEDRAVGSWIHAFELEVDPNETSDVLATAPWTEAMDARLRPTFDVLLTPLLEAEEARLSSERIREINDMGYTGE